MPKRNDKGRSSLISLMNKSHSPRKSLSASDAESSNESNADEEENPLEEQEITFELDDGTEVKVLPTDEFLYCLLEEEQDRENENQMPSASALEMDQNNPNLQIVATTPSLKRASPLSPTLLDNVRPPASQPVVQPSPLLMERGESQFTTPRRNDVQKAEEEEGGLVTTASSTSARRMFKKRRILNGSDSEEKTTKRQIRNEMNSVLDTPTPVPSRSQGSSHSQQIKENSSAKIELPKAVFRIIEDYNASEIAPLEKDNYLKHVPKTKEQLCKEVQYELDEIDICWLEDMNERRADFYGLKLAKVEMDELELLLDRFEKEHYYELQKAGAGQPGESDEDAVCCICLDGESDNSNQIIFCDMCNIPVHQDCYGVPFIPEGTWLCRPCFISPNANIKCIFCPNTDGAFKQTVDGRWAHVLCALWIPEVRFSNPTLVEPVDDVEDIPAARWKLVCFICKKKGVAERVGACIQCHLRSCVTAFHPTCAQASGLSLKIETRELNHSEEPGVRMRAACDKHTTEKERRGILEKVETIKKVLKEKRSGSTSAEFPKLSIDRLEAVSNLVTFHGKKCFILHVLNYWKLKRRSRGGAPLIRNLESIWIESEPYPPAPDPIRRSVDDTFEQACRLQMLTYRSDLTKMRELCRMWKNYQEMDRENVQINYKIRTIQMEAVESHLIDPVYFQILDKIAAKDKHDIFAEPVLAEHVPDYHSVITNPIDLSTMRKKVMNLEYASLDELEADFRLMINNCLTYNNKSTVFYKTGLQMDEFGNQVFQEARQAIEQRIKLEAEKEEKAKREEAAATTPAVTATPTPKTEKSKLKFELRKTLNNAFRKLARYDKLNVFADPVDTNEVRDYLDVIETPMDFSTMKKKIDTFQYVSVADFEADYFLMINNCLEYNADGSDYYLIGVDMKKFGESVFEKLKQDSSKNETPTPSNCLQSPEPAQENNNNNDFDNCNANNAITIKIDVDVEEKLLNCDSTPIKQEQPSAVEYTVMEDVLKELMEKDDQQVFAEPVNLELAPNYLSVISNPMDFSTIKKKLETNSYSNLSDLEKDFNLMIDNCKLYNKKKSAFYTIAYALKKDSETIFQRARERIQYTN